MEEKETYKNCTIIYEVDPEAEHQDPSEMDEDILITYRADSRYRLGNTPVNDPDEWRRERLKELEEESPRTKKEDLMFEYPVYAHVHSGVALSLSPFSCPWDSGQSGVISISRKAALEMMGEGFTKTQLEEKVHTLLKNFLDAFQQYINGNIYWAVIKDADGETVGTCGGGYYGYDHEASGLQDAARETVGEYLNTLKERQTT
jgi:hypothetical protein